MFDRFPEMSNTRIDPAGQSEPQPRLVLVPWTSVPPKFCRFGQQNLPFATVVTPGDAKPTYSGANDDPN